MRIQVAVSNLPKVKERKPEWLKIRPPEDVQKFVKIKEVLQAFDLHTVCQEAHCPNLAECWSGGTATFMLMGDTCTRGCRFCAVNTGNPNKVLDPYEPFKLAKAIKELGLINYVVLTSVARDDLEDGGASHFAACIAELKKEVPGILVEALIPDFQGSFESLKKVVDAGPDVLDHNVETVRRLQHPVRDKRANIDQSLSVLRNAKEINPKIFTKSGLMLGLGETDEEVLQTMQELRENEVDMLTIGQYLRPSAIHLEIKEFVHPEKFEFFKKAGEEMGFIYVVSSPFVRSSYRAGELFVENVIRNK